MSEFRELFFINVICNVICCLKSSFTKRCLNFPGYKLFLQQLNCKFEVLETSRILSSLKLICFSNFLDHKKQNLRFYSSNIACRQYWSSEQIRLESKV